MRRIAAFILFAGGTAVACQLATPAENPEPTTEAIAVEVEPEPTATITPQPSASPEHTQTPVATSTPEAIEIKVTDDLRPPSDTPLPLNKMGVHLLLDDGRNAWPASAWEDHLGYARRAVGEWGYVTELVRLDDLDPGRWQQFMDLCAEFHLKPILRLATTFDRENQWWVAPEVDEDGSYRTIAGRYAEFARALAWPTSEHFFIVGNEPNHGNEWSGSPDPVAYARFLIDVADALHAADPEAIVLNAGFDPYTPSTGNRPFIDGMFYMDEEAFLDGMVAAYLDVFDAIDMWASHPYPLGPLTEGPWEQTFQVDWLNGYVNPGHVEPPPGVYNRGVNGYEWELFKLSTYNAPSLPVMITETGWRHAETTDPGATDNGRPLPSAMTAAEYFYLAMFGNDGRYPGYPEVGWTPWEADSRVVAVTPFALNGLPAEWGHTNWLALDSNGNVLDTYPIFETWATQSARR